MTPTWLLALTESLLEHRALCEMRGRAVPRVGTEWDVAHGIYTVDVLVDGTIVAMGTGRTLERASEKAMREWEQYVADRPEEIENALEVSIAEIQR